MAKDKGLNPVQAQQKREKAAAIKKAKADRTARLTEKLSKRNPERISRQIETLKSLEQEGKLQGQDRKLLADLEKQIVLVKKAKEKLAESTVSNKDAEYNKEGRAIDRDNSHGAQDRHVNKSGVYVLKGLERRSIYWDPIFNPTGLPPEGMPHQEWDNYEKEGINVYDEDVEYIPSQNEQDASGIPIPRGPAVRFKPPEIPVKTTYEAAPVVRDLTKESALLVPAAVRRAQNRKRSPTSNIEDEYDSKRKIRHVEIVDADDDSSEVGSAYQDS
ncbi:hypothetical protein V1511DRAFT_454703 [Dipodascopsis uninucleata]